MVKICLVVLIGLPGSGKTSFCQNYRKYVKGFNVIHICYDHIIKFNADDKQGLYKQNRKEILAKIKILIEDIKNNKLDFLNDSTEWFFIKLNENCNECIILIDDNNYYVGMRYEFYKICRESEISFAQLYFQIDVVTASNRNLSRFNNKIPEYVIRRMNERFQIPTLKWEDNTLLLKEDICIDFTNIDSFLSKSLNSPQKLHVKVQNSQMDQSKVHKVDLLLRKEIKNILDSKKSEGNLTALAKNLNDIRKSMLDDIRNGLLEVDLNQYEKFIQCLSISM